MNRQRLTIFIIAAFVCATGPGANGERQTPDLASAVAQHYPQMLVERSLEIEGVEPTRKQCFAVLEASASGTPQIVVAGYTNMTAGAIRLLQATDAGFEVVAAPDGGYFTGLHCEAEAIDVNNDGRKEAVVRFRTGNSTVDWLFDWDNQNFRNLSPTTNDAFGLIRTAFLNTAFVDVDGDHVMEAFTYSQPPRDGQPFPGEVYKLAGTSYVLDRPIVDMRTFERASGSPQTETETILLPVGAVGPFTLRVVNGSGTTGSGKRVEDAVQSGRIWWNGQEIVSPNHFGNHVAVIERTVTMQGQNELKVRLAGSPGGRIAVVIDAGSWTP